MRWQINNLSDIFSMFYTMFFLRKYSSIYLSIYWSIYHPIWLVVWVFRHINSCRLFNAKFFLSLSLSLYIYIYIYIYISGGARGCNDFRRRKWTGRHEFKSSTRLIVFSIALISLRKVWIQLFSLQLWVNSRAD